MDVSLLATSVVGVLTTFLSTVATKSAERAGEAATDTAANGMRRLYQAIKAKLSGDDTDSGMLVKLEQEPGNVARQHALEGVLLDALQKDSAFAAQVASMLADSAGDRQMIVMDSGAVAGGDVHLQGQYVAGRDVTIGRPEQGR